MAATSGSLFVAGVRGYIQTFDTDTDQFVTTYLNEWNIALKAAFLPRPAFLNGGNQDGVSGYRSAELTIKGGAAPGSNRLPLEAGGFYYFFLGITDEGPYEYQVFAHVSSITPSNKSDGAPELEIRCDSCGSFDISVV